MTGNVQLYLSAETRKPPRMEGPLGEDGAGVNGGRKSPGLTAVEILLLPPFRSTPRKRHLEQ